MEPGANHTAGVVYTDRICVALPETPRDAVAPSAVDPLPSQAEMLQRLVGSDPPERVAPQYLFGVNYAGGNFREGFVVPRPESLDYFQAKGVLLMRLPIQWERLQSELSKPFDPDYLASVKQAVGMMADRNMKVLLDVHNYAKYRSKLIGSPEVSIESFADLWRRLAREFHDQPAIWGYGLMNEPHIKESETWARIVQAAIDAIRAADKKTRIVVATEDVGGTFDWSRCDEKLPDRLTDPANNLCYEWHCYFDSYSGGKYNKTYEYEINRPGMERWPYRGVDPMFGVRAVEPFVKWLEARGLQGIVGEFSVPANPDRDPRWLAILDNFYRYLGEHRLPSTYWAAGTLWTPGRAYVIEPRGGRDRPQMQILLKHACTSVGRSATSTDGARKRTP
jgi:endoglucanase